MSAPDTLTFEVVAATADEADAKAIQILNAVLSEDDEYELSFTAEVFARSIGGGVESWEFTYTAALK